MTSMDGYDDHSMFDELNSLIDPSDLEDDSFNESFDDMGHDHPFADPFVDPIADDPAVNIQGRSPHWMMMACTATPTSGTLTGSTNR